MCICVRVHVCMCVCVLGEMLLGLVQPRHNVGSGILVDLNQGKCKAITVLDVILDLGVVCIQVVTLGRRYT